MIHAVFTSDTVLTHDIWWTKIHSICELLTHDVQLEILRRGELAKVNRKYIRVV